MHKTRFLTSALAAIAAATIAAAPASAAPAPTPATAPATSAAATPPRLLIALAMDQFSADLFAEYRSHFTGGLARLASGAVFPAGYQSHAATETCPGHSTLLTGNRPAHTGIIANTWIDQSAARPKKEVYCAEDETKSAADPKDYVASVGHLLVPTLGERMKQQWPAARNVAVSGKDRAALMMGGHVIDQVWWWKNNAFVTLDGRPAIPAASQENAAVAKLLAKGAPALPLPAFCAPREGAIQAGSATVGTGHFALAAGDATAFRASPRLDQATLDLALKLVDAMKLGQGPAPDMLAVSLSATDYVGHSTGTQGPEMCIQLATVDQALGAFFAALDARHIDYGVVLSADHGGFDMPERQNREALPQAARADVALLPKALSEQVAARLQLPAKGLILGDGAAGDFWVKADLPAAQKTAVVEAARAILVANPQVAGVFTAAEIAATPMPSGSPETWSLIQRARASFYAPRSGDFVVMLRRGVMALPQPGPGYVATHGSPWDYDRRVPILFWRKGMTGFEQPSPVETVDIAPTLSAWINLPAPPGAYDGRCLDLDSGPGSTCGVK
ncbi:MULTISPECIES: alkaline phosphatase family protein [unclassified Novosphingobium]|uniref:alkaline phosphatase family protein n=1 Tax=unclassified Novosphingobium TaxID=2644732 RepID=UPI00146E596A|nr:MULTISPECIES: alkaline phosphatase family protein [unclassified Novosphingobium]NMN07288.1 putative AlkP superfamily pyrophosphatase or phosphodiesterase [Novosphingobium sp. SG919]NMN89596.1 putative AlkP superfamily pyrophosphatase or phosphodiesterase [Novosphingobium sp. SG916]